MPVQTSNHQLASYHRPDLDPRTSPAGGNHLPQQTTSVGYGEIQAALDVSNLQSSCLPEPADTESKSGRRWFEDVFFPRICVQEFLNIARNLREGTHTCRFGQRLLGTLHVLVFIIFEDDVEWVVKIPKWDIDAGEENIFLMSEYATLVFLQRLGTVPTPRVYGASFDGKNPTKTSYYIMERLPGLPLSRVLREH
jgi:hypothetical protein